VTTSSPSAETTSGAPTPAGPGDHRVLAAGTAQNIVGLAVFVIGTFGANILVPRAFGGGAPGATALGIVTLGTQFAFIAAAGTRFGMDMAAVRYVAIEVGAGHPGRIRAVVSRSVLIAAAVSAAVGVVTFLLASPLGHLLGDDPRSVDAMRAAAVALPFVALTYVYLGATRGLKIMRHTLYVQWVGQPLLWIVFMLAFWRVDKSIGSTVLAYAASWLVSTAAALWLWQRETRPFANEPAEPGLTRTLTRYGAPRAPAALLSQALFWVDYFVASAFVGRGSVTTAELGVYSASVRVALAMVLFLTAVSYVFSPFVADLHARGERDRLDQLFKTITRWTVAGTIPIVLLMLVVPGPILQIFGGKTFVGGTTELRILLIGQTVNVSVGAAGFVLIMAGFTGWDLVVYASSFALDIVIAMVLVPRLGTEGAAIAQTVTIAASNALRLWLVWRYVRIHPYDRRYARLLIPAVLTGAAMTAAHLVLAEASWPVDLLVTAVVGGIVYLPGVLAFGLTPGERATMAVFLRRGRGV
jgi:O-antigen/teichoic acid export membrane protein